MKVQNYVYSGFGLRVNLGSEVFELPETSELKQYLLTAGQTGNSLAGEVSLFRDGSVNVNLLAEAFPGLVFKWCGNPLFRSVPDISQWFVFVERTLTKLIPPVDWVDLSEKSFVPSSALSLLEKLAPLSVDRQHPHWYVMSSLG